MVNRRIRQNTGLAIGGIIGTGCVLLLALNIGERFLVPGPVITGHQDVRCDFCHQQATGTFRQQIQANAQFLLGQRPRAADFGRKDVTSTACLSCHDGPNDRHPIYRFFEPRFKKARQQIQPTRCISCHLEHTGKRVTKTEIGYCKSCHKDTALKKDPISIPHKSLIADKRWETCLGCHDYHGNHLMKTALDLQKALPPERISEYFEGGPSPYSEKKGYLASEEPRRLSILEQPPSVPAR